MTFTLSAFRDSPDRGRGLARDMRVRWALEELELPYEERLLTFAELEKNAHLERNPFGQIPTLECDGGLVLFESGAIVLHLASERPGLLPADADARARAIAWMFAALNTVEPPIWERAMAQMTEAGEPWHTARLPMLTERVRRRLRQLAAHLDAKVWLDGAFSAGDLLMVSVLMRIEGSDLLDAEPALAAYLARGKARPAFQRAFAAQYAVFEQSRSG
ncbi:glutathione S-transferase N-terminal domain-containing protein [Alteraurantiacibacter palmitatis]|uniref:Glutathione S-transferase N-terminal domain-containing protein n=1 Tax=Alteraurantiacibacter palmitatis TaxID=2054628 RepID=A0ABV7E6K1_9SPHN